MSSCSTRIAAISASGGAPGSQNNRMIAMSRRASWSLPSQILSSAEIVDVGNRDLLGLDRAVLHAVQRRPVDQVFLDGPVIEPAQRPEPHELGGRAVRLADADQVGEHLVLGERQQVGAAVVPGELAGGLAVGLQSAVGTVVQVALKVAEGQLVDTLK